MPDILRAPEFVPLDLSQLLAPVEVVAELCVVVPAYNEAAVIEASLRALGLEIDPAHIYVVSDGSTDATAALARKHTANVLELTPNRGKAGALQALIERFSLTARYRYILFSDADSQLEPGFAEVIARYAADYPACIVGTVVSDRHGLVSAYRTFEYGLTHRLYKRAQNALGVVAVAPGCASAYRADVIHQLDFGRKTLTEDYDLTLQIHAKRLGRVVYAPEARVITQDPPGLRDYWKQVVRWYTGFWQNFFLHKVYLPRRAVHAEILLMTGDGLAWIATILLALFAPAALPGLLIASVILTGIVTLAVIALEKSWWILPYLPLFIIFQLMNVTAYTLSFARALGSAGKELSWNKVARYQVA